MPVKALDYESLNENVKKVQYAVRGELYLRASELQKEGKKVFRFSSIWFLFIMLFCFLYENLNASVVTLSVIEQHLHKILFELK